MAEPRISGKLRKERELALELLQKSTSQLQKTNAVLGTNLSEISQLFGEKTMEVQLTPKKDSSTFVTEEMTGRSTEFSSPATDQVPELCDEMDKLWSKTTESMKVTSFGEQQSGCSFADEEFGAVENEMSRLKKDEHAWEKEFAKIPRESDSSFKKPVERPSGADRVKRNLKNYANFEDFSGYLDDSTQRKEMSVGAFFQAHSDNVYSMIPQKSPPRREAIALIDETDITIAPEKENFDPMDTQTTVNLGNLLNGSETPKTFIKKFEQATKSKKKSPDLTQTLSPRRPLGRRPEIAQPDSPRSVQTVLNNSGDELLYVANSTTSPRAHSLPVASAHRLVRSSSQMSSGSEFCHKPDSVFPIKASHLKISFGCVKLRTHKVLQVKLRNFVSKRVNFKISITGPGFTLGSCEMGTMTLQANETHMISVDFCPTVIGTAMGQICLEPPNVIAGQSYNIHLFGFGGKAKPEISGDVCVPPSGNSFIDMGSILDLKQTVQRYITVRNRGNIDAFAILVPDLKSIGKLLDQASIAIVPNRVVIPPNKSLTVSVKLNLRKDDLLKLFKKQRGRIIKVLSICCIMGDNVTRIRIKNCIKKIRENPALQASNATFKELIESPNVNLLLKDLPVGDTLSDLDKFDEVDYVADLIQSFIEEEIDLTLNRASDETLNVIESPETTIDFKSMILTEPPAFEHEGAFSIEPSELEMVPFRFVQFYIRNESDRVETFEITTDFEGGLECFPKEGEIAPDEAIAINAKLKFGLPPNKNLQITILYEKGKMILPVTILPEGLPPFMR